MKNTVLKHSWSALIACFALLLSTTILSASTLFASTAQAQTVTGYVRCNGFNKVNFPVDITYKFGANDRTETTSTNGQGNYSFSNITTTFYSVTPKTDMGYTVNPDGLISNTNIRNFVLTPKSSTTRRVYGSLYFGAKTVEGVSYSIFSIDGVGNKSLVASNTLTTAAFDFNLAPAQQYSITFSKTGHVFPTLTVPAHCNDYAVDQFQATSGPSRLFGFVKNGTKGVVGVKIQADQDYDGNGVNDAVFTDDTGRYEFPGVTSGRDYFLIPSKAGFNFDLPTNQGGTILGDTQVDFTARPQLFSVSGIAYRVSNGSRSPLGGVVMTLSIPATNGSPRVDLRTTTNSSGVYSFSITAGTIYSLTPTLPTGYQSFTPSSAASPTGGITANSTTDFNFTPRKFTLSGTVTSNTTPLADVQISGQGIGSISYVNNKFSIQLDFDTPYNLTATKRCFEISASNSSGTLRDDTEVAFVAQPVSYSLTVNTGKANAQVSLSSPTVDVDGSTIQPGFTGANGSYTFARLRCDASYAVNVPTLAGHSFAVSGSNSGTLTANAGVTYTATLLNYDVCFSVLENGQPLANVTVSAGGGVPPITTTANQPACFKLPFGSTYQLTPSRAGYSFSPTQSQSLTVGVSNTPITFSGSRIGTAISGTVYDDKNNPIAGARILNNTAQVAVTNNQGFFTFPVFVNDSYTVAVNSDNYENFSVISGSPTGTVSGSTSVNFRGIPKSYPVCATVADANNNPISGVTVRATSGGTTLTLSGNRYCALFPFGSQNSITAEKPGYTFLPNPQIVNVTANNSDIRFQGTALTYTLSGQVATERNRAVGSVTVSDTQNNKNATTPANGGFSIGGYLFNNPYSLTLTKQNYTFTPRTVSTNPGIITENRTVNFIAIPTVFKLCVRVNTKAATPQPLADVVVSGSIDGVAIPPNTKTNPSGEVCLDAPFEGPYSVSLARTGYEFTPTTFTGTVNDNAVLTSSAEAKTISVSGIVQSATGTPLPEVSIAVAGGPTVKTGPDGRYTVGPFPFGAGYTLTATLAGYDFGTPKTGVANSPVGPNFSGMELPKPVTVSGFARNQSGTPLSGVRITVSGGTSVTTDQFGKYSVGPFNSGSQYTLTANLTGFDFGLPKTAFATSSIGPDFVGLTTAYTITGSVKLANLSKDPVQNIGIELLKGLQVVASTKTAANGTFSLSNVPEGTYTVKATDPSYSFELDSGQIDFTVTKSNPTKNLRAVPQVENPVYLVWNTFLAMQNIIEIINTGPETLNADITLFDGNGLTGEVRRVSLAPLGQTDLIVNQFRGVRKDAYGLIKIQFSTNNFDGRLSFYRLSTNRKNGYDFAFFVPFVTPLKGASQVLFNTTQPSQRIAEKGNFVPNWLQIINLDGAAARNFTVRFFDSAGSEVCPPQQVGVPPSGRRDISGGHDCPGANRSGTIHIIPDSPSAPYHAQIFRYGHDAPRNKRPRSYSFAAPFFASKANGRTQLLPISSSAGVENVVEISNALNVPTTVAVVAYNSSGQQLGSTTATIAPFAQSIIPANRYLRLGESGTLRLIPNNADSLIASSTTSIRSVATGALEGLYGVQSMESFGLKQAGSYNLFLGQFNWLKLCNNRSIATKAQVLVNVLGGARTRSFTLAPYACLETDIHNNSLYGTQPNSYGVIEVSGEEFGDLTAQLLRMRFLASGAVDYASPTPLR